jgi:hypothetical protein
MALSGDLSFEIRPAAESAGKNKDVERTSNRAPVKHMASDAKTLDFSPFAEIGTAERIKRR